MADSERSDMNMLKVALLIGLLLVASMRARAAEAALGSEVTDDRGHATRFAQPPVRIVSLLPSLTETVCALGACARLVGTDRYSNWPALVASLPKLGGIEDASLEQIMALRPDLVLAGPWARVIDRLDELGVPVVSLQSNTLADAHRVLNVVARVLGTPALAEVAWQRIETEIGAATARVPPAWRGRRVYFEVSEAPHAAGASSFIGELLSRLGLENAVPRKLGPFPKLNPEFIVRAQPDVIMASERELADMISRPGWDALIALQRGRSCGFPTAAFEVLIRPGPRLGEAAQNIANCLARLSSGGPP
jgi:iron complex transport system substrate-binding protein